MKIVVFLLLATLLTTCYAVTLKAKAKAALKVLSENLESSPSYSGVFKSLLELTEADEYQQVVDIMTAVNEEIANSLANVQQRLDDENTSYNNQRASYQELIDSLTLQIRSLNDAITQSTNRREELRTTIDDATSAISQAQQSIDDERARRDRASQANQKKIDDLSQAIQQCELAIELVKQAEDQDLQPGSAVFLEVKRKKLQSSLELIEKQVSSMNIAIPAASFIHTLIKITQNAQTSINQEDFEKIIELLQSIEDSLKNQRQDVEDEDRDDANNSQITIESLQSTITSQQTLLDSTNEQFNVVVVLIESLNQQFNTAQNSLGTNTQLLSDLTAAHNAKVKINEALIERLKRDIAAIEQALAYLKSQIEG